MHRSIAALLLVLAAGPAAAQQADPPYLDDRSTPEQLVRSFLNAIDRYEHARAYGYLNPDMRPDYAAWQTQFEDVASVEPVFGFMTHDARAGEIYYHLPVVVQFVDRAGDYSVAVDCVGVTWPLPGLQAPPPYPLPHLGFEFTRQDRPATETPMPVCD